MKTYFTQDHEYLRLEGDTAIIGITNYAQNQLGDVVFVELPEIGKIFKKGAEAATVESVKAASDVYAPVSGEIIAINTRLMDQPGTINEDPEGQGWFMKMRLSDRSELDSLMDEVAYNTFIG